MPSTFSIGVAKYYQSDLDFQTRFNNFIYEFSSDFKDAWYFIEIVFCEWLELEQDFIEQSLMTYDVHNAPIYYLRIWQSGLSNWMRQSATAIAENPEMLLRYAVSARRLHQYTVAKNHLQELISVTGNNEQFSFQIEAYYELALCLEAQSLLEQAYEMFSRIEELLTSYPNPDISKKIQHQQARICVAGGDAMQAMNYIRNLPLDNPDTFILYCEIQFLMDKGRCDVEQIKHYIDSHNLTDKTLASLHTLIARAYLKQEQDREAILHFDEALAITENVGSLFDMGRARTNLASAYLSQESSLSSVMVKDTEALLIETTQLQKQIHDIVGLEATKRDLNYLQRRYKA